MVHDSSTTQGGGFSLQPHMIPELRAAYVDAIAQLQPLLGDGPDAYKIAQPAMGDAASQEFQSAFNQFTSDGPGSMHQGLTQFQQQLREAVQKLGAIQHAYDNSETDTAAVLSSQLEV